MSTRLYLALLVLGFAALCLAEDATVPSEEAGDTVDERHRRPHHGSSGFDRRPYITGLNNYGQSGSINFGGHGAGYNPGYNTGYNTGHNSGYNPGYNTGYNGGYNTGYGAGFNPGLNTGYNTGLNRPYGGSNVAFGVGLRSKDATTETEASSAQ